MEFDLADPKWIAGAIALSFFAGAIFGRRLAKVIVKIPGFLEFQVETKGSDAERAVQEIKETTTTADAIVSWLDTRSLRLDGSFSVTESTRGNSRLAALLYGRINGTIIGTSFFDGPYYGESDFAGNLPEGTTFYRLTVRSNCSTDTEHLVRSLFREFAFKARLIVIPDEVGISRIAGIFARFPDSTHLAFIALNDGRNGATNRGLILTGSVAKMLYEYYANFAQAFLSDAQS